jgi:YidC/Oxa1 family membrane protein insertase
MTNPTLWNQVFVWPIVNTLIALYDAFLWLKIPGAMGFAIIGLTILIRLLLYPLMAKQLSSTRKMANLKPKLDELSNRHKDDKTKLQQAQLALYKEHGINPASGCLPMLAQFPLLIALYSVFNQILSSSNHAETIAAINAIVYHPILKISTLDVSFFGTDLLVKPSQWQEKGIWLLSIPVITAALQWYQSKLMTQQSQSQKVEEKTKQKALEKKSDKDTKQDMAQDMQKQMAIITPLMFGMFAFQFPLGLSLYWNTFGIFGIMQQLKINKSTHMA